MIRLRNRFTCALVLAVLGTQGLTFSMAAGGEGKAAKAESAALPYYAEPAISPDRSEIAFVSGGDIWTVPAGGGEARLLVSHPANESRPVYSPDGRRIAFVSGRTGNGDIYVLTFETGDMKRLTFDDGLDQLDAWSRDGRWIYFSSTTRDIAGMNDLFRVRVEGGTPMQVSADRYVNEFFSAASPDDAALAFTARGISSAQWWRKGHSHIDESEIWLMRGTSGYERVTERGAKEMWPMWSADGGSLFYVSDRGGAQNIWTRPLKGAARQVTRFRDGRVLWPNISYDGRAIVFERDFRIWKLDPASGQASEVPITRRGATAGSAVEHLSLTAQIQEMALSPDGKKIAFVVRGEIFAASAKEGGDAARITASAAGEYQVTWSPDSRRLVYVSEREGTQHLYLYDFASGSETQLTRDPLPDANPRFSPDGKQLAFERDARELRVLDMESKQERVIAKGMFERAPLGPDRPYVWSPDSRWIAFMSVSDKQFKNVYVAPASGGASRPISFLANSFSNTISWSPDGTYILFDTSQRTEDSQLARVDLLPRTPKFREDQFRDLFKEESPRPATPNPVTPNPATPPARQEDRPPATEPQAPAASASPSAAGEQKKTPAKPVEIVFDDVRTRLSLLPVGVDVIHHTISPDGKQALMIAGAEGQFNLYVYSLDELAKDPPVARQLTSTPGFKGDAQFTPDGKEVYYLEQGRINAIPLDTRQARPVAVTAEMDVDFSKEKTAVFNQAWSYLRDHFYDPNYHGSDWQAVRATYAPQVEGARTPDEMRRVLQLMVGELNASHLGVGAPAGSVQPSTGRLGLRFDRVEYENGGRLKITEVIPLSPAALGGDIKPGDYLLAVDGTRIDASTNLDELLNYKINRRVALTVASAADGAGRREVAVRPVNSATEKGLLYRKWVEENRAYVARVSNGRLGYVHMFDMSSASLAQLHVDLDAENHARDGVVIDIRNNNGGFVNVYAIDIFARRGYLNMTQRGFPTAPARNVLGQRALESPTILITNQHSLSDAEDFTEGYRALKLGQVVGEPTAGWIIYTWNLSLIDGSSLRLPRTKITTREGVNMELNPRQVDIPVTRPVGETYTGRDSQLDAAVKELLKQIGNREAGNPARQ